MNLSFCLLNDIHLPDALLGAGVAIIINGLYNWLFKKISYIKLLGKFYHGNERENVVDIRHEYGEMFSITERKNGIILWKGAYQRQGSGLLIGTYDYNYNKESKTADWGEHHLRLLPNMKTMSVLIEPIVPQGGDIQAITWER